MRHDLAAAASRCAPGRGLARLLVTPDPPQNASGGTVAASVVRCSDGSVRSSDGSVRSADSVVRITDFWHETVRHTAVRSADDGATAADQPCRQVTPEGLVIHNQL